MEHCCCFTGHRLSRLAPYDRKKIQAALAREIAGLVAQGVTRFYTGMADGVDLLAADQVLCRYDAKLTAVVPYQNHISSVAASCREDYARILSAADETVVLMERYCPSVFFMRNDYMVAHCGHLIAVYDGFSRGGTLYTLNRAKDMGRHIILIDPVAL